MRSLLEISDLSYEELKGLLKLTHQYQEDKHSWPLINVPVCSLFYENSTRTRVSFELAATNLGMKFIQLDSDSSSETKGEALLDTVKTLQAMGINTFLVRHSDPKMIHILNQEVKNAHFVNAGSGMFAHPSQALLDLYTITQHIKDIAHAKVVICGDIKHSRVANSLITGLKLIGVSNIVCASPSYFSRDFGDSKVKTEHSLDNALVDADMVVALRVQNERLGEGVSIAFSEYKKDYCLTIDRLKVCHPNVLVMHPGPINRGVEIDSELADSNCSLILEQVRNGVYARMAILSFLHQQHIPI